MSLSVDFSIIGHRGAAGMAPENTLYGFQCALDEHVHAVEFDIQRIDDELVVIHDDTVNRTTDGNGAITDFSFERLRQLDAGDGERIPTLREVLELIPATVAVNVELKGTDTASAAAEVLRQYDHQQLVSSFDHGELRQFVAEGSGIPVAPLFGRWREDGLEVAAALKAHAVNVSDRIAIPQRVADILNAGFACYVFTVNDVQRANDLKEMGVTGIFTDRPDLFAEFTRSQ
ncbi:glycerophosphodiester phosphodiesterase family protein [Gammaproteobacteria bacterium]|nr:glycerophosphodiester phosphodiesterase family protein [Gammaproteobacteria bacterium]